jgi:serine/threonine protein kinase
MTLAAGTRLGPYEILSPLGAGGMGAVYSARDTRLQREVAIKVLPAQHMGDPARRQRLLREAQAVSALNHPNIVTLHDVGESDGIAYLVMERVSGRTLDQVIPHGGLRLADTLRLAMQIADGLGKAHAAGILHRDLKPGNVMVTEDGTAKLLDFGLAKLVQADGAGPASAEGSTDTAVGTILGTVAYMSPEQAQGKALDARSDIFSFGTVLYEMATGRRAFKGDSTPAVLAAVIAEEPRAPRELQGDIPRDLERIIQRCLRKDPARRFHNVLDVRVELLELREDSDSQVATGAANGPRPSRRRWVALLAAAVAIVGGGVVAVWRARRVERSAPTLVQLTSERQANRGSFSPDGTQIAFASSGEKGDNVDIWLKIVGEAEGRRLTSDPAADDFPAWSPDGRQIAFLRYLDLAGSQTVTFFEAGVVYLVSPLGGSERRLSDLPVRLQLSWSPDGRWLAAAKARVGAEPPGGIHLISVATGQAHAVTFPKPPAFDVAPAFSPDGRTLAYGACEGVEAYPVCDVYVLSLDSELRPQGVARALTRQRLWNVGVTWTRNGHWIVYGGVIGSSGLWRVRADGGAPERVEQAGRDAAWPSAASSRDRLAFIHSVWDPDIYRLQLGLTPTLLIGSAAQDSAAQYSPDGRRIAFASVRSGDVGEIWLADADGSAVTRLTRGPGRSQGSPRWSPDGRFIVFDSQAESGQADIWVIGVDGSGLRQVTHDPGDETRPSWSRDGHFLYFESNRTGRIEIWRTPAAGGAEEQVTHAGGLDAFESWDGRILYHRKPSDSALFAQPTAGGEERRILRCVDGSNHAVGQRGVYYIQCQAADSPSPSRQVLRHWEAATGKDASLAALEASSIWGLSVSPDERSVLFARNRWNSDLMMIDNFR